MNIPYVLARAGEAAPPLLFPERGPGYRPSPTEDRHQSGSGNAPLAAGTTDCSLARRSASKTTLVWPASRRFTSQVLEGFIPDVAAALQRWPAMTTMTPVSTVASRRASTYCRSGWQGEGAAHRHPRRRLRRTDRAEGRRRSSWLLTSTLENPWRRSHQDLDSKACSDRQSLRGAGLRACACDPRRRFLRDRREKLLSSFDHCRRRPDVARARRHDAGAH